MEPWVKGLKIKEAKAILAAKGIDTNDVCEKLELLKLVIDNVADEAEAEVLMKAKPKEVTAKSSSASPAAAAAASDPQKVAAAKAALANMKNMPARQMKYQGAVMQRDPAYVKRQAKGALDGASEQEIKDYGVELEALAKTMEGDPNEAARQQAESNAKAMVDVLINDPAQAKKFLRTQPAVKALGDSATDDLDGQIDALSQFAKKNEVLFKKFVLMVVKVGQTFSKANDTLNGMTGGRAKYVWIVVACFVAYLWFKITMVVVAFGYKHTVGRFWGSSGAEGGLDMGAGAAGVSLEEQDMYGGGAAAAPAGGASKGNAAVDSAAEEFDEF